MCKQLVQERERAQLTLAKNNGESRTQQLQLKELRHGKYILKKLKTFYKRRVGIHFKKRLGMFRIFDHPAPFQCVNVFSTAVPVEDTANK